MLTLIASHRIIIISIACVGRVLACWAGLGWIGLGWVRLGSVVLFVACCLLGSVVLVLFTSRP